MGLPVVTIRRLNQHKATADQKVFLIDPGARPQKSSPFKSVIPYRLAFLLARVT